MSHLRLINLNLPCDGCQMHFKCFMTLLHFLTVHVHWWPATRRIPPREVLRQMAGQSQTKSQVHTWGTKAPRQKATRIIQSYDEPWLIKSHGSPAHSARALPQPKWKTYCRRWQDSCGSGSSFWQHDVRQILKQSGVPGGRATKLPRHFIRDPCA